MKPVESSSTSLNWSNKDNQGQLKPPLKTVRSFDTGTHGLF